MHQDQTLLQKSFLAPPPSPLHKTSNKSSELNLTTHVSQDGTLGAFHDTARQQWHIRALKGLQNTEEFLERPCQDGSNKAQVCYAGRTLHELTFTDAPELKDCYLHNLAAAPSLTLFKCVLLAASPQVMPFTLTLVYF